MSEKVTVKIKSNAFPAGLDHLNGQKGKLTGKKGVSGKTDEISIANGLVYLEPTRYDIID